MLSLFLPCAAGSEMFLQAEVQQLCRGPVQRFAAGVAVQATWSEMQSLNLHSRVAQRVLIKLSDLPYRSEHDVYAQAHAVPWEDWMGPEQTLRIDISARRSPLKSLQFVTLRVKDALCDRFRAKHGARPSVDTRCPHVRIFVHLEETQCQLYLDSSGAALFKRGWRQEQGDAPLKETLAASMLYAIGWPELAAQGTPLYDPCCGSGTLLIEALHMAHGRAAGLYRSFGFEQLRPFQRKDWLLLRDAAKERAQRAPTAEPQVYGSDIAFRMVDFARHNAERAGVLQALQLRGGDALERMPPCTQAGVLLVNPPYGDRLDVAGKAAPYAAAGREAPQSQHLTRNAASHAGTQQPAADGSAFFQQLGAHWKQHYKGWQAWVLTPDMRLPGKLRMREMRRVPLRNGALDCRLFGFDLVRPAPKEKTGPGQAA